VAYWLNVDVPTNTATLHADASPCADARRETDLKGRDSLKKDGGWLRFQTEAAAQGWVARELESRLTLVKCARCY